MSDDPRFELQQLMAKALAALGDEAPLPLTVVEERCKYTHAEYNDGKIQVTLHIRPDGQRLVVVNGQPKRSVEYDQDRGDVVAAIAALFKPGP